MNAARLAKNIGSGLMARAWSSLLGLIALPIIVRGLGAEGYGLLALSFGIMNLAAVGDCGVGRAVSKYLAEGDDTEAQGVARRYVPTALTLTAGFGVLAATLLWLTTPLLTRLVFQLPDTLVEPAQSAFTLTALGLPAVLLRILLAGILIGRNRLDQVNAVLLAADTVKILSAVTAILIGASLATIVGIYVSVVYLHSAALLVLCRLSHGSCVSVRLGWQTSAARQLLGFGSWGTLTTVLNQILLQVDRWILGIFVSIEAVGYYSVAWEVCSRQSYVAYSVSRAFFPLFSEQYQRSRETLLRTYLHANKMIFVATSGLGILLAVFSQTLLAHWVHDTVASEAGVVMAILALAFLAAGYAEIPFTCIFAGAGRPDVLAAISVVAVTAHTLGSVVSLQWVGPAGVAASLGLTFAGVAYGSARWLSNNVATVGPRSLLVSHLLPCWGVAAAVGIALNRATQGLLSSLYSVLAVIAAGYLLYLALTFYLTYSSGERSRARRVVAQLLSA